MTWIDIGSVDDFKSARLTRVKVGEKPVAISYLDGKFGAISSACAHFGGPLADGKIEGDYLECPWHYWRYNRYDGKADEKHPGLRLPSYEIKEEAGRLLVSSEPLNERTHAPWTPPELAREPKRKNGKLRVLGLSMTAMTAGHPRYSTSEALLTYALEETAKSGNVETQIIKVRDLKFRECEGFYSKAAKACTWPCSITMMDRSDEMHLIYEAFVHWADVIVVATPIRWGSASSLYYKMVERMNSVQNQITLKNRYLVKDKVVSMIITGGQDNVQAVAGQMLTFFSEIGCTFPQFPFIAHTRGWSAEDMENNMRVVQDSQYLKDEAVELVARGLEMSRRLIGENALTAAVD